MVDVERIKVGKRQTSDTLISEEALLFAKYLRHVSTLLETEFEGQKYKFYFLWKRCNELTKNPPNC
jgi:hypothetical protein